LLNRPVDPMAVRLFVLMAQYRKPVDFTDDAVTGATNGWHTLQEGLLFGYQYGKQLGWQVSFPLSTPSSPVPTLVERFNQAVDDDFNFAGGLAILFELAKELRREGNLLVHQGKTEISPDELQQQWHTLVTLGAVLGLAAAPEGVEEPVAGLSEAEIEEMIQRRGLARQGKDFAEGDRIRNELQAKGITLIDKPGGITLWHRHGSG